MKFKTVTCFMFVVLCFILFNIYKLLSVSNKFVTTKKITSHGNGNLGGEKTLIKVSTLKVLLDLLADCKITRDSSVEEKTLLVNNGGDPNYGTVSIKLSTLNALLDLLAECKLISDSHIDNLKETIHRTSLGNENGNQLHNPLTEKQIFSPNIAENKAIDNTKTLENIQKQEHTTETCKIPNLDPYSPEIRKYITYQWKTEVCWLRQKGTVKDGILQLKISNVQRAGYYYIKRGDNDDSYYFSDYHSIVDNGFILLKPTVESFCLKEESVPMIVASDFEQHENGSEANLFTSKDETSCSAKHQFKFFKNRIVHHLTSKCVVARGEILKLSGFKNDCNLDDSIFEVQADGQIKHIKSGLCIIKEALETKLLKLTSCDEATKFTPYGEQVLRKDLHASIKMEGDFVRLVYKIDGKLTTEHHMYPVKEPTNEQQQKASRDPNKLNIVIQIIDSMSRASVQRYMKETYTMLDKDPNTVIMKGQTVTGDATLNQLTAILAGGFEEQFPEAIKGGDRYVDTWPFIFSDFHKEGYISLYSEDYPTMATFNYKLNGFKEKPTVKYVRPWWQASDEMFWEAYSPQCRHLFMFEYLRNFQLEYKHQKQFILAFSNLAHNEPSVAVLIDQDMKEYYKFLNDTGIQNNSVTILLGDHGDRSSGMRSTMQGHLEQRLPFLSFTFPAWFKEKYSKEMSNIRKNSKILTTHFDHHVTLRHLLNFPNLPAKHKLGKSLLTDISVLNRTCNMAGIHSHWCPCLHFRSLPVTNDFTMTLAEAVVKYINEKLFANEISKRLCAELKLKEVSAIQKILGQSEKEKDTTYETYQIMLEVSPSNGMFESTVLVDKKSKNIEVATESRINIYGNQPICLVEPYPNLRYLRQYCYCKSHLSK